MFLGPKMENCDVHKEYDVHNGKNNFCHFYANKKWNTVLPSLERPSKTYW